MSKQNEIDTRPGARSWDPYFKQSNVKKLKNLLNKALNKGLAVTELNGKQITVVELERLINEKEVDPCIKHYLSSTQQEDIVPWYKDYVDLSLMYKDNNNVRYIDESRMYLNSSQSKYIFDTNPALKSHTAFIHTHDIIDKNLNSSSLNYQVNVQKYPSNNVFVNESGRIDLFSYNLSYLFVGERNHNAKSNNSISEFVPFVTNFSTVSGKASYYTSADAYKNSFKSRIADVNNKTGLVLDESTYQLSYISSSDVNLKLDDTITTAHGGEMWGFGNGIYLVPEYSSNFNAQKTNTEISTAYSQIGVMFIGDSVRQQDINIKPYISGENWYTIGDKETEEYIAKANQYKEILKHEDKLDGVVTVYTHPITCYLEIPNENNEDTTVYSYYSYLSDTIELNVADKNNSKYLLYSYTVDNSSSQEYDFSSKKYTYTYLLDETNKKIVDLCKYVNSYTLSDTEGDILTQTTDSNVIRIKFNNELLSENYTLKTVSQLINPISGSVVSDKPMNFNVVPCSNPSLTFSDMNLSFDTSSNENTNYMNINLSFTYADSIIEHLYAIGENDSDYVHMFKHDNDEWTYNGSCTVDSNGCLLVYSYLFDGGGVVSSLSEGTYNTFSQNCDLSNVTLSVQYSYNITYDRTKYTKPRVDVVSSPRYNVSYIADKAIVNIISDDFNIWGDVEAFNTNSTYLVKNSYILCDSTDESVTIELSYQHKSETGGIGKLNVSTYCATVKSDMISYTGIVYEVPNTNISTHWEYNYNDVYVNDGSNNHVFYYDTINLINDGTDEVILTCDNVADLIYKTIPNTVFETLYNKLNVPNVNTGFCANDDPLPYPYDIEYTDEADTKYLLRPVFESSDADNVVLNTIRNVISVNGEDYPLQSEYYIVTIESEYYLYCIFNSPIDDVQVLPPLLYHINVFDENTNLCCKDYEYYTENKNSIKADLTRPVSYKTSYMLYGFSDEIVRNIKTNTEYTESFYKDKSKDFEITVGGVNYCHCYFPYKFDDANKLKEFTVETTNQAYTYITKYTGFIQSNTDVSINDGTFAYNVSIETARKIKKLDVTAYITTNFNDSIEDTTHKVHPRFIFSRNRNGILADKGSYVFIPDISTNYDDIVYPSSTEPIIDEFKSV